MVSEGAYISIDFVLKEEQLEKNTVFSFFLKAVRLSQDQLDQCETTVQDQDKSKCKHQQVQDQFETTKERLKSRLEYYSDEHFRLWI